LKIAVRDFGEDDGVILVDRVVFMSIVEYLESRGFDVVLMEQDGEDG
jgi:hypothetical protein